MEDPIIISSSGITLNAHSTLMGNDYISIQISFDESIFDFAIKKADEAIKCAILGMQNESANCY